MLGYPGAPNGTPAGQAHSVAVPVQGSGHVSLSGVKLPEGAFVRTCGVCAICALAAPACGGCVRGRRVRRIGHMIWQHQARRNTSSWRAAAEGTPWGARRPGS